MSNTIQRLVNRLGTIIFDRWADATSNPVVKGLLRTEAIGMSSTASDVLPRLVLHVARAGGGFGIYTDSGVCGAKVRRDGLDLRCIE